jgi:hypothetical protein
MPASGASLIGFDTVDEHDATHFHFRRRATSHAKRQRPEFLRLAEGEDSQQAAEKRPLGRVGTPCTQPQNRGGTLL